MFLQENAGNFVSPRIQMKMILGLFGAKHYLIMMSGFTVEYKRQQPQSVKLILMRYMFVPVEAQYIAEK